MSLRTAEDYGLRRASSGSAIRFQVANAGHYQGLNLDRPPSRWPNRPERAGIALVRNAGRRCRRSIVGVPESLVAVRLTVRAIAGRVRGSLMSARLSCDTASPLRGLRLREKRRRKGAPVAENSIESKTVIGIARGSQKKQEFDHGQQIHCLARRSCSATSGLPTGHACSTPSLTMATHWTRSC